MFDYGILWSMGKAADLSGDFDPRPLRGGFDGGGLIDQLRLDFQWLQVS